eukprot:CAMPEP_0118975844 /NCGR_PEP_ID=MMETSP1173-20130426/17000_1 /TAXON_ID=1034831 /ORGANISM="Rhizochromulina marina cf, Strain CCMP1243" /LENGTH=146 /DNA_ID=CAMNT_0006925795 /DNA_START=601 /DNA_END=1041 /DNA_ORIENTATION=+
MAHFTRLGLPWALHSLTSSSSKALEAFADTCGPDALSCSAALCRGRAQLGAHILGTVFGRHACHNSVADRQVCPNCSNWAASLRAINSLSTGGLDSAPSGVTDTPVPGRSLSLQFHTWKALAMPAAVVQRRTPSSGMSCTRREDLC